LNNKIYPNIQQSDILVFSLQIGCINTLFRTHEQIDSLGEDTMVPLTSKKRGIMAILLIVVVTSAGIGWWWFSSRTALVLDSGDDSSVGSVLKSGYLADIDDFHQGTGEIQLFQDIHGNQTIRFLDVTITSGPDLYVYLSKKSSFSGTDDTPGEFVNLGLLPAIQGNFSVNIPPTVNGSDYASVLIWCQAFVVPFTFAPLS
jgi:hypothetical protein